VSSALSLYEYHGPAEAKSHAAIGYFINGNPAAFTESKRFKYFSSISRGKRIRADHARFIKGRAKPFDDLKTLFSLTIISGRDDVTPSTNRASTFLSRRSPACDDT